MPGLDYDIIKDLANQRRIKLGNPDVDLNVKEFILQPTETLKIEAKGDNYWIHDSDNFITVESDNGLYDNNSPVLDENIFLHTGEIGITNNINQEQRIVFVIVSYIAEVIT